MAPKYPTYVAGLIVFVALVIFFGGILFLSGREFLVSRNYPIRIEFNDVAGVRYQSPVEMRGYQIGWVRGVTLSQEKVVVIAEIKREFKIPLDSSAQVKTLNFVGEKAVAIVPGRSPENLSSGAIIQGMNRDLMSVAVSVLESAKAKVESADVASVAKKATDFVGTVQDFVRSAGDKVRAFDIARLNDRINEIGKAGEEFRTLIQAVQGSTEKFSQQSGISLEKFNASLLKVDAALEQIAAMSEEIKTISQTINSQGLFVSMDTTIREIQALLVDIKKNPKKYVRFSIF